MSWLGSGSHSPFSIHVDDLCPTSTSPGGQLKVILLPSTGKTSLFSTIIGVESLLTFVSNSSGYPQLAIEDIIYYMPIMSLCVRASYDAYRNLTIM